MSHPQHGTDLTRVAESTRSLGIGRRLLTALETEAARDGDRMVRLETSKSPPKPEPLPRAGYAEVDVLNDEPHAHPWFQKLLPTK